MCIRDLVFLLFFMLFLCCVVSEEFKYKVIAPEYICSKENMSQTAIRLIGEDVPKLKYNWTVTFNTESKGLQQRHIIMIWTSVRKLNNILQTTTKDDINQGVIYINNSLLTPDVKYIINITAEKQIDNKTITNTQQIAIEYISKNNPKSTMSAFLTGPEVTYSDMTYTAQADIQSCSENNNYELSWQLLDNSKKMVHEESTKSRILQLPPGTLAPGQEFLIQCLVKDNESKENKSSMPLKVNVLERGMELRTYTKYLKIGMNQTIYLNAFFNDPDNTNGELTLEWKCNKINNEPCTNFESNNNTELHLEEGFFEIGRYLFTITAKKGLNTVSDTTTIEIVEEFVPIIDVEDAITSCNPSDLLKISAHVSRLIAGCTLQWSSVEMDGFQHLDLTNIPGEPGKLLTLFDEEMDNLEPNENNTEVFLEKQHDLVIPTSKNGLQGSSKYLFRLTASCPCSKEFRNNSTSQNDTVEPLNEQKFVVSSADVTVTTFDLPVLKRLKVSPKSGQALKTVFTFTTTQPKNCNKPLFYKYGITTPLNKNIFYVQQYDTLMTSTILPYYDDPIQTILEVCDSKNACNSTLGPKVIVKLPNNFTQTEINVLLNHFNKSMNEQDYFNAFTLSSSLLRTANQMEGNLTFEKCDKIIQNVVKTEIHSFLNATGDSWVQSASKLLKSIKLLDSEIHLPQDILNDILALRDKISEKQSSQYKKQIKLEKLIKPELVPPSRKLLSLQQNNNNKKSKRIVNDISIDEMKDYLEISEITIKRLTDFERVEIEKKKVRDKLQNYIPKICQFLYSNYKTNQQIVLSSFILEVEKINLIRKFNEFIFIPYEMNLNAKLQIGRELAEKYRRQNSVCIGKLLFIDDYFHIPQYVYDIKLYASISDYYLNTQIKNFGIIIEIPVKSVASSNQMFQCVLWEYEQWDMSKCKTLEESSEKIKCACKSLGYFSIVPVERTTTATSKTTLKLTSLDEITQQNNNENIAATTFINNYPNIPTTISTNDEYQVATIPSKINEITTTKTNSEQSFVSSTMTSEDVEEKNDYKSLSKNENTQTAAVWSISFLSVGIGVLVLAFCILMRKMQRSKAVQSFQTVEYAKYFDEQNLE